MDELELQEAQRMTDKQFQKLNRLLFKFLRKELTDIRNETDEAVRNRKLDALLELIQSEIENRDTTAAWEAIHTENHPKIKTTGKTSGLHSP